MAEPPTRRPPVLRALLLVPGAVALLAGLNAALLLLDLPAPVTSARLPQVHGVLLVLGFVGTLIALERAVAWGRGRGYLAPALLGAGALALLTPAPRALGAWLLVAGCGALALLYVPLWRRQPAGAVLVQATGAVLAVGGAVLWAAGVDVPWMLPWLVGFLVLTIAGERLELSRVGSLAPGAEPRALAAAATVVLAAPVTVLWPAVGYPLMGLALLGLCAWLLVHDVARRTVRGTGLPRYTAVALLAGYAWLAGAGATWVLVGRVLDGGGYDAVVHSVFLGFVLSMIMAHAPIILPAVLRRPLPYRAVMYLPLGLLHASLLLRVVVGDLRQVGWAWQVGGALNIVSVLAFAAVAVWSSASPQRVERPTRVPVAVGVGAGS